MIREKHHVVVRSRHHDFETPIPRHYDSGNAVLTAERNALQLIIPPGESFFIRSVQRLASKAKDPELKEQIKAFIGQEAMHSKETNRALEIVKKNGFPVEEFHAQFEAWLKKAESIFTPKMSLAATAAAEHYTAVFSIWNIGTRYAGRLPPAIRDLSYWHGAEELEHKAVAFDLLQEVAPRNYFLRAFGFLLGMAAVWLWYRKAYRKLLKLEGLSRSQIREERRKGRKIRIPMLSLGFPRLFTYLKPGFHPDDLDDGNLSAQILAEQEIRKSA